MADYSFGMPDAPPFEFELMPFENPFKHNSHVLNSTLSNFFNQRITDQSSYIPESTELNLLKLDQILEDIRDFDEWNHAVLRILKSAGLKSLVDIDIPRPELNSDVGMQWAFTSRQVTHWLASSISEDLLHLLRLRGAEAVFADEFMAQVRDLVPTSGFDADCIRVKRLNRVNPLDFPKTVYFVRAYAREFRRVREAGINLCPYGALLTVLSAIPLRHKSILSSIYTDMDHDVAYATLHRFSLSEVVTVFRFEQYIEKIVQLLYSFEADPVDTMPGEKRKRSHSEPSVQRSSFQVVMRQRKP
ncbi:uncharacterized protein N7483_004879 [Penicillium malachiteum]|uniref:uncharacterized protein n=1 Tax=Penicillium malachiteum TaxID=1324776 RepID=UPI002546DBE3|nr:uncharacterized protein N7483_004879 [Penicillium malachiteum]KAJ5730371.1 hypothetical protein N7483_004879 [Penicillium malachiteum]